MMTLRDAMLTEFAKVPQNSACYKAVEIRRAGCTCAGLAAGALTFFLVAVVFLGLGAAAFLGLGAAAFLAGVFFLAGACSMPAHEQAVVW